MLSGLATLFSCTPSVASRTVFTSFYPIYFLAKNICGDKLIVKNLTPLGNEPHDYSPTAKEVGAMIESKGVLVNGISFEPWLNGLPDELNKKVHLVTRNLDILKIDGRDDPHVWLDPIRFITCLENVFNIVVSINESNKSIYEENFNLTKSKLLELDTYIENELSGIGNRYLLTSHAAYGYFCERYNFTQIYINGIDPDDEPTPQQLTEIINSCRNYHISTIFTEELISKDIANMIARETGAKVEVLNPLESLNTEELKTEDYISVMKDNANKIKESYDSI